MKCHRPFFISTEDISVREETERPEFPAVLTDYLTGKEIPFSNRDNIRQKILRFLCEEKGYQKDDISCDREIRFRIEDRETQSLVDISVHINGMTLMVWKCASGSVVSRERQVIATARLLEDYLVPFAAVTNGIDAEFIEAATEKVIGTGLGSVPSRQELLDILKDHSFRQTNKKKLIYEQRILFTYDAISCDAYCKK